MSDKRDGEVETYCHEGVDLVALAAEHKLWHWRCGVCGQYELVKEGEEPKPCFRCDINSGAFQRRIDEAGRIGDAKRALAAQSEGVTP